MIGPKTYRLQWRREMRKRLSVLAVACAVGLVAVTFTPLGISTESSAAVTGHSSFYNGDEFDPCLASIVGIMRLRVMWFNHQVLVERYNGDGAYVYATELGAPNPTMPDARLVHSGVYYEFVDPNGVAWHVDEAYWDSQVSGSPVEYSITNDGDLVPDVDVKPRILEAKRWYTWIVAVGKPVRDNYPGSDPHEFYNFIEIVNTCKFRRDNLANSTVAGDETVNHPAGMGPSTGHLKNDTAHDHEKYTVALWVGSAPKIAPAGTETPYEIAAKAGIGLDEQSDPTRDPEEFNNE